MFHVPYRSPQVRTLSSSPSICFIYSRTPFGSMGFGLFGNLIQRMLALYEVRVPQTGDLPLASFRFHLAMDTLALS